MSRIERKHRKLIMDMRLSDIDQALDEDYPQSRERPTVGLVLGGILSAVLALALLYGTIWALVLIFGS